MKRASKNSYLKSLKTKIESLWRNIMSSQTEVIETPMLEEIMSKSRYPKEDQSYSIAKQGVAEFISQIVKADKPEEKINKFALDEMIAHIDDLVSKL